MLPMILEEIPSWVGTELTPWGIIMIMVLGIATGRFIVPKFYYLDLKADRDEWKSTAKSLERSVGIFADALPDALEVAKTADKILTSVGEKADRAEEQ